MRVLSRLRCSVLALVAALRGWRQE